MSTYSMTYGRTARPDFLHTVFHAFQAAGAAVLAAPARLDAWLAKREMEHMTAQDVLAYARSIEDSDPGFAADLRGAAMRADGDR